jgi:phenylacetate-CoA ligase
MSAPKTASLDERLQAIICHAYDNAPGFRRIMDQAGITPDDVQTVADLERVPVTSKDRLIQLQQEDPPFGGFLAVPPSQLTHIFMSPGPLYDPEGPEEVSAQAAAEAFHAAGFGPDDIVINTFMYHLVPAGLLLDQALRSLGCTVVPTGVGNTDLQVKIMLDLKVTGYVGTPSFLMTLIQKAEESGLNFKEQFALKRALFTAEPYPPSLRQTFEGTYGLSTSQAYGTADLGLVAYECEAAAGLHFSDEVIVEIVDSATGRRLGPGQAGEIVVTTFSRTYPLIRFGTGDLSAYTDEPCSCGRTSPRLIAIMGRVGDAVKVRGMFVHPNQIRAAVARFPAIARAQGVITRPAHRDEFTLKVELSDPEADKDALSKDLSAAVKEICRVSVDNIIFVEPGTIPADARGIVDERTWE